TRLVSDWSSDVCSSDLTLVSCCKLVPSLLITNSSGLRSRFVPRRSPSEMNATHCPSSLTDTPKLESDNPPGAEVIWVAAPVVARSEERRVGKECRTRWG